MKTFKAIVCLAVVSITWCNMTIQGQTNAQPTSEMLYQRWHHVLNAHPILDEPQFFRTNTPFTDLTMVVEEIDSNKIAMAYFLCEKMATESDCQSPDIDLLDHVAGINLWFADYPTYDIGQVITTNLASFRREWRAGVYKDPSAKVAQICEERLSKETSNQISPRDLAAIRRYGIFGLPELVRQIGKNNSKHAFAAYLIIVNESDQYREYLNHSDQQFKTAESKIAHIKEKVEKMKMQGGGDFDVVKKISAALVQ